jgi:hypothetical protein
MSSGDLTEEVRANKLAQEISGGLLTRASDVFLNVHGRPEVGRGCTYSSEALGSKTNQPRSSPAPQVSSQVEADMLQLLAVNSPSRRGKQICHPHPHTTLSDVACIVGPKPELKLSGLGAHSL